MHVLPHNFPAFVVVMTISDLESLEIHKIMHCFPTQTVIIYFFFIINYTFIAKTSDKDIRFLLNSFVILMAQNCGTSVDTIIECTIHIKSIRLIARLYETAVEKNRFDNFLKKNQR